MIHSPFITAWAGFNAVPLRVPEAIFKCEYSLVAMKFAHTFDRRVEVRARVEPQVDSVERRVNTVSEEIDQLKSDVDDVKTSIDNNCGD
jgi:hypothetical protein